eukprot:Phypoly_transcript_03414.p1 GENE.Phypoly_transcript_03414~~Phypoly_transcript_03414.p1  ORF type:complete len:520 (+),score=111.47 Phypoly_transcript_03414:218-1777(+)
MDIPSLEQELLNSQQAAASQLDQAYVDNYFTSSDSNEEQPRRSAPGSPNSPASASPTNTPIHQIPQIKLEHTPSFVELTAAASLSPHSSGRRSSVRKVRRTTKELSQSDDDDERREKVKNSEKKRRDRLSYWFGELHKLLLPPPSESTSEQDKITYARKKRELRKEDILEMTTTHLQDMKHKTRLLNRIVAKMSLEHQLQFNGFTQEDISMAFDAIYSQLRSDRDSNVFRMLLTTLYVLAKKSSVPQHEAVVHEISSGLGVHPPAPVDVKMSHSGVNIPVALSPITPPSQPVLTPQAQQMRTSQGLSHSLSSISSPLSHSSISSPLSHSSPVPSPIQQHMSPFNVQPPTPVASEVDNSYLEALPTEWGKYVYPDGSVYEGEWRGGKAHGRGTLLYSTGDRYTGEWIATQKQGQGEFVYANGDVYKGEWKADRAHGYGVLMYSNGNRYTGNWVDDKRHGFGVFESNGTRYEGEWANGRKEGKGSIVFPTGDIYTALWKNGVSMSGNYTFRAESPWANPDF